MLRKLMKYEITSTYRTYLLMYGVMVGLCLLTILLDQAGRYSELMSNVSGISLVVTACFFLAVVVATTVLNVNRFYKGVFRDEGYLLNTLPVSPWQIICSKLVLALFWTAVSALVMGIAFLVIIIWASGSSYLEFWNSLVYAVFNRLSDPNRASFLATCLVQALLGLSQLILLVYAALSLGHLFQKGKVAWSVGAGFLLSALFSWCYQLLQRAGAQELMTAAAESLEAGSSFWSYTAWRGVQVVFLLLWCVLYWGITQYILTKKLNLE